MDILDQNNYKKDCVQINPDYNQALCVKLNQICPQTLEQMLEVLVIISVS